MRKISLYHFLITGIILLSFSVTTLAQQWGLYTLYATKNGTQAYLVDTANTPVTYKTWNFTSTTKNAYSAYLIPGDTLVRTTTSQASGAPGTGGVTGRIQKVIWGGTVAWDYTYTTSTTQMHHDICPLPNGNVLFISYETKTAAEAVQAGLSSSAIIWSEKIVEVKPTGATTGIVVWEWKLWDHLCQNYSSAKDNYVTSIVNNPQLLNINYAGSGTLPDRYHMNGIDYNASLNQIVVSIHFMNSVFIIDHSTTTAEAAGHTGGVSGKGGDFLYRWGNPASYGATGTANFVTVHDAHWVSSDNPNYPNYLAGYNNQGGTGGKTAIDIWNPPYSGNNYSLTVGQAYAPTAYTYRYNTVFTATNEGNSQQLPNGNMLVNNFQGSIYEVNSAGTTLWTKTGASSSHAYRYTKCYVRGPIVTASPSVSSICLGGSVTLNSNAVSVTEASPTYTYAWSSGETTQNPVVTPTANTVYTVTITNTAIGCSSTANTAVNVNPLPTANAGIDVSISSGNSTTLTATGGGTYLWSNSGSTASVTVSPTITTTYTVTVTNANGCSATDDVIVTVTGGSVLSVTTTATPQIICVGASAQLGANASGGSGYTYLWSSNPAGFTSNAQNPTVNPSNTTNYTVTVTSGISTTTSSTTVTVTALPAVNAGSDQSVCEGTSIILTGSGASSLIWNNGVFDGTPFTPPIGTNSYTVTGTENGCSNTDEVVVTVNALPAIPTINQNINSLVSSIANSYQWYYNGSIISGAINQNLIPTQDGNYQVEITDINNCSSISAVYNYTYTGIDEISAINSVSIFPNPTNGIVTLEGAIIDKYDFEISVFDLCGKMQFQERNVNVVDLTNLQAGIYYLTITSGEIRINKKLTIIK